MCSSRLVSAFFQRGIRGPRTEELCAADLLHHWLRTKDDFAVRDARVELRAMQPFKCRCAPGAFGKELFWSGVGALEPQTTCRDNQVPVLVFCDVRSIKSILVDSTHAAPI